LQRWFCEVTEELDRIERKGASPCCESIDDSKNPSIQVFALISEVFKFHASDGEEGHH